MLRLSEDWKPAKLRANHIATASQQDEEVRQRRAPACNYRSVSYCLALSSLACTQLVLVPALALGTAATIVLLTRDGTHRPTLVNREISLVPPDPAGTHIENQLRMPSEEDDRRISIPWVLLPSLTL